MKTTLLKYVSLPRRSTSAPALSCPYAPFLTHHVLLGLTLSAVATAAFAQAWQTVDDFQYARGQDAEVDGLTVSQTGTVSACGSGMDPSGTNHWLVMSSDDGGKTWSAPLDDFVYPGQTSNNNLYNSGITADSAGNLYVIGTAYNGGDYTNHWLVRRSGDHGLTWSTVDDFVTVGAGAFLVQPTGVAADAAGNVYVAGGAVYANPSDRSYWTVRKGIGGTNFTMVDSFPTVNYDQAQAVFVHPTAGIFAAGEAPVATNKFGNVSSGWVVRRSTNAGASWTTIDTFVLLSGYVALATGIGADALGNVYVVGQAYSATGTGTHKVTSSHWIVRKSSNGGNSWTTVDNYQLSSGADSQANSFVADSQGNLFVAGYGDTGSHWIVRKNPGGTDTWSTDDNFQYSIGYGALAVAIAANASGNVFVGGSAYSGFNTHWLVRKR